MDDQIDTTAVAETAKGYYWAMVKGDGPALRHLFDSRAPVTGYYEGQFLWLGLEDFIAEAESLLGQHGEETCTVESLRIDGDIATAAVRGAYAGLWFLDHLAMVKIDGVWRIVAKTFHVLP